MSILNYLKENLNEKTKWAKDVKPKKGKMHKLLNIPYDKNISDVYTSGKKLAIDLIKATGSKKKASNMLAFAANIDKTDNVLDKALRHIKTLEENISMDNQQGKIEGNPKAIVDAMIANAPGMKEQIGTILKYAANSMPIYDIWDVALDYYESLGDEEPTDEEPTDEESTDEEPTDEEPTDEEPTDEEPVSDDDLAM